MQVLATPRLLLGRTGHVVARCLPPSDENDRRSRSVSRRHACIEWHGGYASIVGLRSASGTSVNGRSLAPGREPFRLEHGDEIGLGQGLDDAQHDTAEASAGSDDRDGETHPTTLCGSPGFAPRRFYAGRVLHFRTAAVDEADIGEVKVGQRVISTVTGYPERRFPGIVTEVRNSPTVVQEVVTYGGDVSGLVPDHVLEALVHRLRRG